MARKVALTVLALVVVILVLGGIKGLQISALMAQGKSFVPPPESVSVGTVKEDHWQPVLAAIGSLEAVQGVTVSAEVPGVVRHIAFESGATVRRGALLVQLDTATEKAEFAAADAQAELGAANLQRTGRLLQVGAKSAADLDSAKAAARAADAQTQSIRSAIAKKTIRAPFSGRLGTRQVNLGGFVANGAPIVSLQSFDPIYVDFTLPQRMLSKLAVGQDVEVTTDAFAGKRFAGQVTTINPELDAATRNVGLQATLPNADGQLRPGMFVETHVVLPERQRVLTVPATAVIYAPYGDSVFVVEHKQIKGRRKPADVVRQQFVRLGETRGDIVSIVSGLKPGQRVVTSGAFKLRPGMEVAIQGSGPDAKLDPKPTDS